MQKAIDECNDGPSEPATVAYTLWLHREFCSRLPDEMLWMQDPVSGRRVHVQPGVLRDGEVEVGRHVPPAANALPRFLARFEEPMIRNGSPRYVKLCRLLRPIIVFYGYILSTTGTVESFA